MGKAQPEGLFSSLGNLSDSLQVLLPSDFCCRGPEEGLGSAHLLLTTSRNPPGACMRISLPGLGRQPGG